MIGKMGGGNRGTLRVLWLAAMLVAFTAIALRARPGPAGEPSVALPPELDRVLRDYEQAWQAGDERALAALFVADGLVATPRGWTRGTENIVATYATAAGPLRLRAVAFEMAGSVAVIIGAYRYGDQQPAADRGKFILALRRSASGRWLIVADLDARNMP